MAFYGIVTAFSSSDKGNISDSVHDFVVNCSDMNLLLSAMNVTGKDFVSLEVTGFTVKDDVDKFLDEAFTDALFPVFFYATTAGEV